MRQTAGGKAEGKGRIRVGSGSANDASGNIVFLVTTTAQKNIDAHTGCHFPAKESEREERKRAHEREPTWGTAIRSWRETRFGLQHGQLLLIFPSQEKRLIRLAGRRAVLPIKRWNPGDKARRQGEQREKEKERGRVRRGCRSINWQQPRDHRSRRRQRICFDFFPSRQLCNASICLHRALYLLLFYSSVCHFVHSLSFSCFLSLSLRRSLSFPSLSFHSLSFYSPFFLSYTLIRNSNLFERIAHACVMLDRDAFA